jgi:hypothetical protein
LQAQHSQALQRVEAKQEIVAQLIDGRISLLEAATRFGTVGRSTRQIQPDTEALCRTVIGWANLALMEKPERAELVTAQLECELQSYLEHQEVKS